MEDKRTTNDGDEISGVVEKYLSDIISNDIYTIQIVENFVNNFLNNSNTEPNQADR